MRRWLGRLLRPAGGRGRRARRRVVAMVLGVAAAVLLVGRAWPWLPVNLASNQPCRPAEGRFLGIHRGKVAVFDGLPGGCSVLREDLGLPAGELPSYQRETLEAGIPFTSETERLQIMEGLGSEASK
ncbi:hypothetical protein LIP_2480 [Limnochorda pilosa]|uniref:Bypass of forespore C C-terminal domain-containing protein n=2 Tax=Limnochorda pilosa TaxID=1555112 RepID=A0A0K2SMI6_LIMPI|nr:hypothetical protein LIP_2480 [Limnochorda pilosa]